MFVQRLEIDGKEEIIGVGVIDHPTWGQVSQAIQELDGINKQSIILEARQNVYMGIAGGEGNAYIVAGNLEGTGHFILAPGKSMGKTIYIMVGGQENEYADFEIANLDQVLTVAKTFFEKGVCDERFMWNKHAAMKNR